MITSSAPIFSCALFRSFPPHLLSFTLIFNFLSFNFGMFESGWKKRGGWGESGGGGVEIFFRHGTDVPV